DANRRQRIDMLSFAIKEIEDAKLTSGEDEALEAEETRLSSFEKLYSDIENINEMFGGSEDSLVPVLKKIKATASRAFEFDKDLAPLVERVEGAFYELSDISEEFRSYSRRLVFDPERLSQVQDRLELLYKLKKKYASSSSAPIAEVIAYCESARTQLEKLGGTAADRTELEKEIKSLSHTAYEQAHAISSSRKAAAFRMSVGVEQILQKLGMSGTRFSVNIDEIEHDESMQTSTPYGIDDVEFLISANPGSPLLPLAKIASGGELSRVMLAIKTILAQSDMVSTLVFDEIDTGIGGSIAVAVGSHMKMLASKKQILCITHLASIAVYADTQIKIQKSVVDDKTSTHVHVINDDERVEEIARMLSGDTASVESLEHARLMLKKFGGM
ncbi:MAG: DNA repair protein RecN, partial [Treponema sp.]|nr:DNA repair protein RecN [Treponema sp.]